MAGMVTATEKRTVGASIATVMERVGGQPVCYPRPQYR